LLSTNIIAQSTIDSKPRVKDFEFYKFDNGNTIILKSPKINTNDKVFESKLPYPILFIHGINSDSEVWNTTTNYLDSQYQFTFGGRFDFCLNADGNNNLANKNFYPTPGADISRFETSVQNGDYYYVNFDVGTNGSFSPLSLSPYYALSNQSAITKQGAALGKAIERVMQLTGKNKVVLIGHSMGGLCSREYIENPTNWQSDGQHHVAKLLTVGTPHGGSNMSGSGFSFLIGMDDRSEAIRDLRTSYYYSGEAGRFLFGGVEIQNSSNMNDNLQLPDFYNVDVNCNGVTNENLLGLNQKTIDNLIDYSCIIGRKSGEPTDGVVTEYSADFNNFYPSLAYSAKLFYYSAFSLTEVHVSLASQYYEILQGMDEPNVKELAYEINTDKNYIGFTTMQSTVNSTADDTDFYKFSITSNVNATISISNIVTSQINAEILDITGNLIGNTYSNSNSPVINFQQNLALGDYYLKISSLNPTNTNYTTPYQFAITTSVLGVNEFTNKNIQYYPNPTKDRIYLENQHFIKATVFSILGQELETINLKPSDAKQILDLSKYEKGNYMILLENEIEKKTIKIIRE
jgi:pimeloyl-ACP methyl ester carboxylesterase